MEKLIINTGQETFLMLERLTIVNARHISGVSLPLEPRDYLLIESMAQLGSMHVRYCCGFECHSFLSGIGDFQSGNPWNQAERFTITGDMKSRSTTGFLYSITAESGSGHHASGKFLFATIPYDMNFQKSNLKSHYEKVFSCLRNGMQER